MTMRRPYLDEFPRLLEIEAESFPTEAWEPELYVDILQNGGECSVITEGLGSDRIVAQIWTQRMEDRPDTLEIVSLSVTADARRKGYARSLVEMAIRHARVNRFKSVSLHVRADNTGAQQLYSSLGFRQVDVVKRYYLDDVDAYVFERS